MYQNGFGNEHQSVPNNTAFINKYKNPPQDLSQLSNETSQPLIEARCEMCSECSQGSALQLEKQGWGLYGDFQFCPYHEDMV